MKSWPGEASAKLLTVHSPAAEAQVWANVHGGLEVFWIVVLPLVSVMTAVSPGAVSWRHWKLSVQTLAAPSCSTTVELPCSERISRMVPPRRWPQAAL